MEVGGRLRLNDGRALITAAVAGCGIMFGPAVALAADLEAGRLVRVLPDYDGPSRPVTLLHPADRRPSPKVRSFIDWATVRFRHSGSTPMERSQAARCRG